MERGFASGALDCLECLTRVENNSCSFEEIRLVDVVGMALVDGKVQIVALLGGKAERTGGYCRAKQGEGDKELYFCL